MSAAFMAGHHVASPLKTLAVFDAWFTAVDTARSKAAEQLSIVVGGDSDGGRSHALEHSGPK